MEKYLSEATASFYDEYFVDRKRREPGLRAVSKEIPCSIFLCSNIQFGDIIITDYRI